MGYALAKVFKIDYIYVYMEKKSNAQKNTHNFLKLLTLESIFWLAMAYDFVFILFPEVFGAFVSWWGRKNFCNCCHRIYSRVCKIHWAQALQVAACPTLNIIILKASTQTGKYEVSTVR